MNESLQTPAPEQSAFEPWAFLRRRLPLIAATTLLAGLAALIFALLTTDELYSAEATTVGSAPRIDERLFGPSDQAFPAIDFSSRLETESEIASLDVVAERTAEDLGGEVSGSDVEVSRNLNSNVLIFEAVDENPDRAAGLANGFAENYIELQRELDLQAIDAAERQVRAELASLPPEQRDGPIGSELERQLSRLAVLEPLQTGGAQIVDTADVPFAPDGSTTFAVISATILGGILGLLIGVAIALVADRLDPRVKSLNELRARFGLPLLGTIPRDRAVTATGLGLDRLTDSQAEAFRLLRGQLRLAARRNGERRRLMVTSPSAGDGKSTVARYLAAAAAEAGERALLVEGDLRHPSLAEQIGVGGGPGLTELLAGEAEPEDVLARGREPAQVDVLVAGRAEARSIQLLESDRARELFEHFADRYDLIVVDSPAITASADAAALTALVDSVILVGRVRTTEAGQIAASLEQLRALGAEPLGLVANAISPRERGSVPVPRSSSHPPLVDRVLRS